MTIIMNEGRARTMDFNANDVGFVPRVATHYIENTGNTDAIFLEMFKADQFVDVSLNNWLRHVPPEAVTVAPESWPGPNRQNPFRKGAYHRRMSCVLNLEVHVSALE